MSNNENKVKLQKVKFHNKKYPNFLTNKWNELTVTIATTTLMIIIIIIILTLLPSSI